MKHIYNEDFNHTITEVVEEIGRHNIQLSWTKVDALGDVVTLSYTVGDLVGYQPMTVTMDYSIRNLDITSTVGRVRRITADVLYYVIEQNELPIRVDYNANNFTGINQ